MGLSLYIGNKRYSSWSMRPWVLLKALDIPFEERLHFFVPGLQQPAFRAFSPSGKVPALHDDAESGTAGGDGGSRGKETVVYDSLAIFEYLAEDHAVWPRDRKARAWSRCATAEMHSGFAALRNECGMNVALRIDIGAPSDALQKDVDRIDQLWCEGLERFGGPWLAGETFSGVDAFFAPVASRVQTYGLHLSAPAAGYATRLLEHPAVAQWVAEGIQEQEREPMHEEECLQGGRKLLADLSQA